MCTLYHFLNEGWENLPRCLCIWSFLYFCQLIYTVLRHCPGENVGVLKASPEVGDRAPGFKRTRNHKVGNGSRGPGWNGAWGISREGRGILKPGSRGLLLWRIRGWGQWLAERKFKASLLLQHHSKRRRRGGRRSPVVRPNCSCGSTWAVFCCLLTCWPAGLLTCRNPPFSPLGLGWPPATFSGAPSSPPRRPHLLPATPPPHAPPQLQIHPLSAPPHPSPPTS